MADHALYRQGGRVSVCAFQHGTLGTAKETGATPYDMPGVEMGHDGELCSFDTFLRKYKLRTSALQQLATIVRGADTDRLPCTSGGWVARYFAGTVTQLHKRS